MTPLTARASAKTGRSTSFSRHNALLGRALALLTLLLISGAAFAQTSPVASNVSISGTPVNEGVQLSGSYTYFDADGNPESGTTFQWYRSGAPIPLATGLNYTLTGADVGAQIIFEVTPRDGVDPDGLPAQSPSVGPVGANEAPVASSVSVSGSNTLGANLTGSYSYSDAESDAEGSTTFQWLRNGAPIPGANSTSYTVVVADVETNLRFAVTPAASSGTSPGSQAQSADFAIANSPPVLASIGSRSGTEAATKNIPLSATDPDGDALSFSFSGVPGQANSFCSLTDNGNGTGSLNCTPAVGQDGNYNITVTVTDNGNNPENDQETFSFNVGANDAPVASSVSISGTNTLGSNLTGSYSYSDTEGDAEGATTFQWLRNGVPIAGANSTSYTVVVADVEANLRFQVTPVALTGASPGAPVQSADFAIANSSPVLASIGNRSGTEAATTNIPLSATDPDGDSLSFSFSGVPGQANSFCSLVDNSNGTGSLNCSPAVGQDGDYSITVTVTDNGNNPAEDEETFTFSVGENQVPVASSVSISGANTLGSNLTGNYSYSDPEGDDEGATTFQWLRNGVAIPGATTRFYTVAVADVETNLRFQVTPAALVGASPGVAVQSADFPIANSTPNLAPIGPRSVREEEVVNIPLSATDPDGDLLSLSFVSSPATAQTFCSLTDNGNGTGSLNCAPAVGNAGTYAITVTATDNGTSPLADSEGFTLTVDANQAPTASGVSITITTDLDPQGVGSLGDLLTGSYTYADAEGDVEGASTFRWLRDGVAIPGAVGSTYTATVDDVETNLTFEVTPVASTGALQGTPVTSANRRIENIAPEIDGQTPNIETPEDTPLEILLGTHVQASDAEDQPLTLTVLASPDGPPSYTREGPNGNTIRPALDLNGTITVPVTVNDGFDNSLVFNVQVNVTPVNDLPTFVQVAPPGLSTPEDSTLNIVLADLVVSDPDNDPSELTLELAAPGPSDNYTLAGATAITPALNFNGQVNVTATVRDLEGSSAPFNIPVEVTPENDLPVLVAEIDQQQAIEDSPFSLDIKPNFRDDDVTDTLTYSVQWTPSQPPNIDFDPVNGVFSGTPQFVDTETPGPIYSVIVTAADLVGDVSDTFDLTINALGRANLNMGIDIAPATASPSEELRWTFTTNNPVGPVAGENVMLTGSFIGEGITVTANGGVNCTLTVLAANDRTDFSCDIGQVTVGGNQQVQFTTTTTVATEIIAFATSAGAQRVPIDPNEEDNSDIAAAGVADAFSTLAVQDLGTATILSVAAGDLNGDGATDIVVGTASGQPVQVFFADAMRESCNCQRDFLSAPISIPDTGANTGVALADFDNNGTLDLVVANGGDQDDVVYSNDGNGNFSMTATLGPSNANDVAVGDFNNNGDMDVVVAASSPNLVYFGNGDGTFRNPVTLGNRDTRSVAVGRFDNNNRMDIAFANVGGQSTVYLHDGGTRFVRRDQLNIGDAAAVAAGDLNGDGRDDLVFGRIATNTGDIPSNPVLINPGGGNFGNPLALLGLSPTRDVLIGDINEDGSPDLVFISSSGVHQIWVAAGGTYELHGEQIMDLDAGFAVLAEFGDTDDGVPGGIDLALGGRGNAGVGVWLNDSEGNLGLGDNVPPELTLSGEASVSVPANTSYVDAGATAFDNIDGDISSRIVADNPVNLKIVGSYTVTYSVQDRAGNSATQITRNVNVTPNSGGGGGGGGGGAVGYWLLALLLTVFALRKTTMNKSRIHGVMAVSVLLLLTSAGPATAQEVRYSWLDMSVLAQDVDRSGVQVPVPGQSVEVSAGDGSGVRFRGSLGTWNNLYLLVSYGSTDIDVDAVITNDQGVFETSDEFDFTNIRSGIGVKWSIFQKTDLFAEVTYDSTDLDFGSFAGEDFDADAQEIGGSLGFRTMFGDHFELMIAGRYTSVGDVDLNTLEFEDDTLYSIGFAWEVIRGLSIVGDYESGEFSNYALGFRLDLSED